MLAALALAAHGPVPASGPPASSSALPASPPEAAGLPVALLLDLGSGHSLLDRKADIRFVPASMAKVMTAYVAFELIEQGKLLTDQTFRVAPGLAQRFDASASSMHLRDGEDVSVDMLLRGLLTVSANDAAEVLAEGFAGSVPVWCALMNAEARRLGMADSSFANPHGLPDGGKTYVSARDLARLGEALIYRHPELYRRYFGQRSLDWPRADGRNHDPVTGVIHGADGMKTGHTNEAGYNFLGSAERDGARIMMVVAGGTSTEQRAAASRALLEWGFSAWARRRLFPEGAVIARARVQDGAEGSVPLVAQYPVHTIAPNGSSEAPQLKLIYEGPLVAPIASGQKVAELEIVGPAGQKGRVPLYAARDIALAGPFDRLRNGLAGMLP